MDLVRKPEATKYYLKWNNFESQILAGFSQLYHTKSMADVTLVCEGNSIKAHKLVLSMYSPYLRMILTEADGKHPTITIDGVKTEDLVNVLEFLYLGKVCVKYSDIQRFVETARFLNVDGIPGEKKNDMVAVEKTDKLAQEKIPLPWTMRAMSTSALPQPDLPWVNEVDKHPSPEASQPSVVESRSSVAPMTPAPRSHPYPKRPWFRTRPSQLPHHYPVVPSPQPLPNYLRPIHNPYLAKAYAHYYDRGPVIREVGPTTSPGRCSEESYDEPIDMQVKTGVSVGKAVTNEPVKPVPRQPSPPAPPPPPPPTPRDIELFTTPSGMVVSTAFNKRSPARFNPMAHPVAVIQDRRLYASKMAEVIQRSAPPLVTSSMNSPLCLTNKSHRDLESSTLTPVAGSSAELYQGSSSQHYSKAIKYTPTQVKALVQSVDGLSGPFVPCRICQKVVKRERLRTHIYECHLVNGEKITCQYCGVALKSKGSYRVHVWRHRNGNLKKTKLKERPNSE